jgi:hypothetical protein
MWRFVSAIDFASVSDAIDAHHADGIVDLVDDTIVTRANSPIVVGCSQLPAARWARVPRQRLNRRDHTIMHLRG